MKIAVIGSGISGLTTAYLLSRKHEVHVFEANPRLGGHTHTVDVEAESSKYAIDTGFIVFNDWTYPNFIKLMTQLGVTWKDSSMSFSVKTERTGIEYNGTTINSLFAQRMNFFRPSFHRMIRDILRFNRESVSVLETGSDQTLAEYLKANRYSKVFKNHYLVPMGAAIWSSSAEQMDSFPIEFFVRFFKNHGMLSVDHRPTWKVIEGGSRSYLEPLTRSFAKNIHLSAPIKEVRRDEQGVVVRYSEKNRFEEMRFDDVVFACHSDETIELAKDLDPREREVLGAFAYQSNSTVLHTDISVLPLKRLAWAAWNYFVPTKPSAHVSVTYHMNILQGIVSPENFLVSLNLDTAIDESKVIRKFNYRHPVYSKAAFHAQKSWAEISGKHHYHFAGAYWGYGFHEDGVKSALAVAKRFGETL